MKEDKELELAPFLHGHTCVRGGFEEELYSFSHLIEQVLLQMGAKPNKDYTYLDLVKHAQPYVVNRLKEDKVIYAYTTVDDY